MHAQLQTNTNTAIKIPGLVVLIYIVKSDILRINKLGYDRVINCE